MMDLSSYYRDKVTAQLEQLDPHRQRGMSALQANAKSFDRDVRAYAAAARRRRSKLGNYYGFSPEIDEAQKETAALLRILPKCK